MTEEKMTESKMTEGKMTEGKIGTTMTTIGKMGGQASSKDTNKDNDRKENDNYRGKNTK